MRTVPDELLDDAYLPENDKSFKLKTYAVKKEILGFSSKDDFTSEQYMNALEKSMPGMRKTWQQELAKTNLKSSEYYPIFLHPLQNSLLKEEIQELSKKGIIQEVQLKGPSYKASMSFRTLVQTEAPYTRIKLPLTMQMTSVLRHHAPSRVSMGPKLTKIMKLIESQDAHFSPYMKVIPESFGSYLDESMDKKVRYGINMMLRDHPLTHVDEASDLPIELNSLFEIAPNGRSLFTEIMWDKGIRNGREAFRYFDDYSKKVLDGTLGSFLRYGTSFEGHQQNTFAVFNTISGDFKGLMIQDLAGGMEIYRPIFEIIQSKYHFSFNGLEKALYDEIPIGQEIHTTLNAHLIPLAVHLSDQFQMEPKLALSILKNNIEMQFDKVARELQAIGLSSDELRIFQNFHQESRESILERPYLIKSLLSMRLMQTEKRIDSVIENPFKSLKSTSSDLQELLEVNNLKSIDNAVEFDEFVESLIKSQMSEQEITEFATQTQFFKQISEPEGKLNLNELLLRRYTGESYQQKRKKVLDLVQKEMPQAAGNVALDTRLQNTLRKFLVKPLPEPKKQSDELIEFGRELFHDPILSGHKNISCNSCHMAGRGTSDGLALSIGEGAINGDSERLEGHGTILRRNAPFLYNLGQDDQTIMFWDGRVEYRPKTGEFITPEPGLNGPDPQYKDISKNLTDALAAQALFPMASPEEMRGVSDNVLAELKTNREVWDKIVERLKSESEKDYVAMFSKAYPKTRLRKMNIGHVGSALSAYMRKQFDARQTPLDRYLLGEMDALTARQKKGLDVFLNKGKCIACHFGSDLGGKVPTSIGVPHIQVAGEIVDDLGREEVTKSAMDRYKFKAPSLRNIALSGPYMHNGAFATLEDVVEHYDDVHKSLMNYEIPAEIQEQYQSKLIVDKDAARNQARFDQTHPILQGGLNFTEEEEEALVDFLKHALTDEKFLEK